jgi:hypothetical protein
MTAIRDAGQHYSDRNERALAANFKTLDDQRAPSREMPTTTLVDCPKVDFHSRGADRQLSQFQRPALADSGKAGFV